MNVPFDYGVCPQRYRLGMQVTQACAAVSLYERVAAMLTELGAGLVVDIGCAEGALRAAVPASGPRLVGVDLSATLLRAHPPPVGVVE